MKKYNTHFTLSIIGIPVGLAVLGLLVVFAVRGLGGVVPVGSQSAAAVAADLSSAADFSVLAALSVSAAGAGTTISGDLGLSPGLAVSKTGPWTVGGSEFFGVGGESASAQADALDAFNNLAGQPSDGAWASTSPAPGVYSIAADTTFSGTLTLTGDYDDVWVFQIGRDMTFSGSVALAGNAQACNVFWQIGRDATIAAGTDFTGTLVASRDVSLVSGATVDGRIMSLNSSITTDGNTISGPTCTVVPAAPPAPAAATLHVIKLVVNGSGGTAVAGDFNVHVKNAGVEVAGSPAVGVAVPGTTYSLAAGTYVVSEDANASYTQTFTGACDATGSITLAPGDDEICTIVNTDIPPPPPLVPPPAAPPSGGGGGGSSNRVVPLISILKVPTPLALPGGQGSVTYDYTVTNVADEPLVDVTVTDDKCSSVTFLSGDTDNDQKLDANETWKYSCATTLSKTTTNTAIATGYSDDADHDAAIDTAIATVVVGVTPGLPDTGLLPPLIDIVKVPSRLTPFPYGGGQVLYTYTVTNPGVVAMHDVTVIDDMCSPVAFVSGDTNGNSMLDTSETWTYLCASTVSISTRNVATAEGRANGFIALGYAFATVLVSAPGLPNTGYGQNMSGNMMVPGILTLVAILSLALILKRYGFGPTKRGSAKKRRR